MRRRRARRREDREANRGSVRCRAAAIPTASPESIRERKRGERREK